MNNAHWHIGVCVCVCVCVCVYVCYLQQSHITGKSEAMFCEVKAIFFFLWLLLLKTGIWLLTPCRLFWFY